MESRYLCRISIALLLALAHSVVSTSTAGMSTATIMPNVTSTVTPTVESNNATESTTTEAQNTCFHCDPSTPNCHEKQQDDAEKCFGDICWVSNNRTNQKSNIYRGCGSKFSSVMDCTKSSYNCQWTASSITGMMLCECCCSGNACNRDPLTDENCGKSFAVRIQAGIGAVALVVMSARLL